MKTIKIIMLMAALAMTWGCKPTEDDDMQGVVSKTETVEKPTWSVNLTGNDEAPSWTAPDPSLFESSMFIMVKLQDELKSYSTDNDLMTVFIGDECRAVPAVRNEDGQGNIYFVLKIRGNTADRDVTFVLSYYCASLKQIFMLEGQETFATERTYGYDEDFVPQLLKGSKKYPVQNNLTANMPEKAPFKVSDGDLVAVFAGEECRGVGTVGKTFTTFRTDNSETLQLRYFSAEKGEIYILKQTIALVDDNENITLAF